MGHLSEMFDKLKTDNDNQNAQHLYDLIKQDARAKPFGGLGRGRGYDEYSIILDKGIYLQARLHDGDSDNYNGRIHICIKHLDRAFPDVPEYIAFNDPDERIRKLFMECLEKLF